MRAHADVQFRTSGCPVFQFKILSFKTDTRQFYLLFGEGEEIEEKRTSHALEDKVPIKVLRDEKQNRNFYFSLNNFTMREIF